MDKNKITINDIHNFNKKIFFLLYGTFDNGEQIENFDVGDFLFETKEVEAFSNLYNRLDENYDFDEAEVVQLMNNCIKSYENQFDKIPNETTKNIIQNRIKELQSIIDNFTNTIELNEVIGENHTGLTESLIDGENQTPIGENSPVATESFEEAEPVSVDANITEAEQDKKDSIIAKVLFGLLAAKNDSIEKLQAEYDNEYDQKSKEDIQKQIDKIKASWKLKVENQSDSFEIEDKVPGDISNEYKILNNQNGHTDTISANDNNSLNISHDKDKPVNETSIAVSINTLCNQMEGLGHTPFTFNFNASTPQFISGIYNTLMADLDAYKKKGMNAICINGKNLAIFNLKSFNDEKEFIDFVNSQENNIAQQDDKADDLSQQSMLQENKTDEAGNKLETEDKNFNFPTTEDLDAAIDKMKSLYSDSGKSGVGNLTPAELEQIAKSNSNQ